MNEVVSRDRQIFFIKKKELHYGVKDKVVSYYVVKLHKIRSGTILTEKMNKINSASASSSTVMKSCLLHSNTRPISDHLLNASVAIY